MNTSTNKIFYIRKEHDIMIDTCAALAGKTRSEIIREGIELVYAKYGQRQPKLPPNLSPNRQHKKRPRRWSGNGQGDKTHE